MTDLRERLPGALADVWAAPGAVIDAQVPHRRLQQLAEAASYWLLLGGADGDAAAARRVTVAALAALSEQQDAETGLFLVGDNVLSPPDTSFTVNGLARLALVLRAVGAAGTHWADVADRLQALIGAAAPALRSGGVHTPNHRWELASALARSWAVLGDDTLRDRAEQWLAEGIDAQPDGLYSERSPNYAAYVSNPSLTTLAELLDRPELLTVVHRDLHAHTLLTDADGVVCTLQSRRQDQGRPFGVAVFEAGYRVATRAFGCADCAAMAQRCAELGGGDPVELAADLLSGAIAAVVAPPGAVVAPAGWFDLAASELTIHRAGADLLVVRAASDVAAVGRVCSGVNHEPTFAAFRSGGLRLAGARLSRGFFGLGPFRADSLDRDGDVVTLRESATAAYYQPLGPDRHEVDGGYTTTYEGRFAAKMSFEERRRDPVTLATSIVVRRLEAGLAITVSCAGPSVPLSLELALGADPVGVDGEVERVEPTLWVVRGAVRLTVEAGERWAVEPAGPALSPSVFYEPGEALRYLAGTDASAAPRLALAWRSETPLELRLRRLAAADG